MEHMVAEPSPRFEARATAESHFAWLRTRFSVEQTLMSWMRTATALIGFGFTLVQFFERLQGMEGVKAAVRPQMPRYLGLALIAGGTTGLLIALWQYRSLLKYLGSGPFAALAYANGSPIKTPLFGLAAFLSLIGLLAFGSILLRIN